MGREVSRDLWLAAVLGPLVPAPGVLDPQERAHQRDEAVTAGERRLSCGDVSGVRAANARRRT
jgi:hypothetical protein